VSLLTFTVLILTKAPGLAHKGQCPPWQTTVSARQVTSNQDDDAMHYVQVQIIERRKGLVQNYELIYE